VPADIHVPCVSHELAERIQRVADDFSIKALEGPAATPTNPQQLLRFGDIVAPLNVRTPEVDWRNRVLGLGSHNLHLLEEVLSLYRRNSVRPWFELQPSAGFGEVAEALSEAGAHQVDFHTALYGLPTRLEDDVRQGVEVRLADRSELALFARLRVDGFEISGEFRELALRDMDHWFDVPNWKLYFAFVGGEPAGMAVLTLTDGVGYLANAASLPAFRRRGIHRALLRRRINDAAAAGCDLIAGLAAYASTSQHNMEREGLRIAYTAAEWRLGA
jgi:ribosomal protein S18 acetylase RimI-like enzyme